MKIMSLNGWGGKLSAELLAYLSREKPDILCLQEVVHSPEAERAWLTYRDGDHVLPQRANFFNDVCSALPSHSATFCPAAEGVLWDGERSVPSRWGLATFVDQSLPVIAQAQDFVFKSYSPAGYGDHPRSRSAHAVRVYDRRAVRTVCVTHMHGLRDLNGKGEGVVFMKPRLGLVAPAILYPEGNRTISMNRGHVDRGSTLRSKRRSLRRIKPRWMTRCP